jgi:hypothetical protein
MENNLSEQAQKLKSEFQERVKKEGLDLTKDPDFPYDKENTYIRFLTARNFNYDNAMKMLWDTTLWRYIFLECYCEVI